MSKFVTWSGIVHATLRSSFPKLKLGQARELLAASLGHNSYASLREHDLQALESSAIHVLPSHAGVLRRAYELGLALTDDQWWVVQRALTRGEVSLFSSLGGNAVMPNAARRVFEDTSHPLFHQIARAIGMQDGQWAHRTVTLAPEGSRADELTILVYGEVRAFSETACLATPVIGEVTFPRVGRQLYGAGHLVRATQNGQPYPYEPIDEGDVYGP